MPAVRLSSCYCRVDNEASRIVFQLISQLRLGRGWRRAGESGGGNGTQRYQSWTISCCVVKQAAATTQVKADISLSICSALSCIHLLPPHCGSSLNEEVFLTVCTSVARHSHRQESSNTENNFISFSFLSGRMSYYKKLEARSIFLATLNRSAGEPNSTKGQPLVWFCRSVGSPQLLHALKFCHNTQKK